MDFKSLGINDKLISALNMKGIKAPTPIQREAIPLILNGRSVIGEAKTGTGKTLAFLLPIFQQLSPKDSFTQALILAPTRELAIQITAECENLNIENDINILSAYGGRDIGSQIKKLKKGIHIIIATPGRLLDHLERDTISLSKVKFIVLDEADEMLLMGFRNEIDKIMRYASGSYGIMCFSATMSPQIKKMAYRYMEAPVSISIRERNLPLPSISQEVVITSDREKQDALASVLREDNPFMAIIFCRTKRRANALELALAKRGFHCEVIHSDVPQSKRERIIKSFRNADIQYLIATDIAARGIDISGVTNIYNYDCPERAEIYIHRIGRTGRADKSGRTCMFITPKDDGMLYDIEKKIGFNIPKREI